MSDKLTNFERVSLINATAGNVVSPTWATVERQFKIISREYDELSGHVSERDAGVNLDKLRDDICDVLVTTYGLGFLLGIDVDADMVVATEALKSRFDRTYEDYLLTQEKYAKLGVDVHCREVEQRGEKYFVTICTNDVTGNDGEKYVKGKWLKSYKFHEPVYAPIDVVIT